MSELVIGNVNFMVNSLIARCPNIMMARELTKNAIESASLAKEKKVVFSAYITEEGIPKLSIWNTGPGMTPTQLREAGDIANSINKTQSLDDNFGMGAKVASLEANLLGVRYRSCHNGKVHEIILCAHYDNLKRKYFVRYDYPHNTGTDYSDVMDATHEYQKTPEKLAYDWTEVVLFGNEISQNTVTNPFNLNPKVPKRWLPNALYQRFFRIPKGVEIIFADSVQSKGGDRKFKPYHSHLIDVEKNLKGKLQTQFNNEVRSETVEAEGIKIHFYYDGFDPNNDGHRYSYAGNTASDISFCSVVFKDEMYDFRKGNNWYATSPKLNIPFGNRNISVIVELPDCASVMPEGYREEIRWNNNLNKQQVIIEDFGDLIRANIPTWLQEIIRRNSPAPSTSENVQAMLKSLLEEHKILNQEYKGEQTKHTNNMPSSPTQRNKPATPTTNHFPSRPKASIAHGESILRVPDFVIIQDEISLKEHPNLNERAAEFIEETNTIFINMRYEAPQKLEYLLNKEYANKGIPDLIKETIYVYIQDYFKLRIGRTVVYALAKRANRIWTAEEVKTAISTESLSMAADDFMTEITSIRKVLSTKFKTDRTTLTPKQKP